MLAAQNDALTTRVLSPACLNCPSRTPACGKIPSSISDLLVPGGTEETQPGGDHFEREVH